MNRRVICPTNAQSPYDEVSHEIDNNILTITLPKDRHRVQAVDGQIDEPIIDVNCLDKYGKKCKKGCPKINVMHNQEPTPKKPEEEMLLLRTTRQITLTDDMKHSLEVEFKSPRNYIPLPEPGPTPPIIIPKEPVILKKLEDKGKKKEVKQ
ncbi:PREDICTED: uncharacterized protein LOC108768627 [Trachymyrmex cornetzi]|uniref:uncharacterized protein LOC108768627 n=1 Tax=Trachymyrmex cornetzi TaxID=471704 RepID=UPI00084F0503|nr:PREDICTED: uncharacterized protein LOC108768627 [Trachymyrmex cornetzi]